ncbi:MAG: DUF6033 family protein [Lachnospiraceae bacterium]|nr:DUF6033 family protein [Lachnospiraceae bacterium]
MTSGIYGMNAYQQAVQSYKTTDAKKVESKPLTKAADVKNSEEIKTKAWSPIDTTSSLVPKSTDYGMTIGNVELSEKASAYYDKLKSKFGNMEFILVSNDMKSQVQQNAAAYGNASKQVVLIDAEKLEKMAEDPSYAKKYEGIIQMSQMKLSEMKNSLASSGASVKNFGMSVDSNGNTSFFATLEKSSDAQAKRIEKKQEEKRAQKKKEAKEAKEERMEKIREKNKAKNAEETKEVEDDTKVVSEDKEYEIIEANSFEALFDKVSAYTYNSAEANVFAAEEMTYGQNFDFKG